MNKMVNGRWILAAFLTAVFSFAAVSCGKDDKKECEKKTDKKWDAEKKECVDK